MTSDRSQQIRKAAFVGLFLLTALPVVTSPAALVAGFVFSFFIGNPLPEQTSRTGKSLLKLSVIGLGFGINFNEVIEVGSRSVMLTLVSIAAVVVLGVILGQAMQVPSNTRMLVSFGTAICGGSAIAAMAPVIKARDQEIAVSLATVFTLNAVALILFPPLGQIFDLTQQQFGLWAALAIHDTSSVVGASASYGAAALAIGTTVKLTRALWIAPCTLVAGAFLKSDQKPGIPLFIIGFICAAFVSSWLPAFDSLWHVLHLIAKQSLVMTLFLIGAGLTRKVLAEVGLKPLLLGIILWVFISATTLGLIVGNLIQ
jgi:uncharacterized integral membrane protein (TIGR00698 family)